MIDVMHKNLIWQESNFLPPDSKKIFDSLPMSLSEVVSQWPNSAAVVLEEKVYNFRDLANRVAGLSDEINELSHHPGPIALLQKAGLDAIAAWFACSLAGRPFLLLEPDHPPARLIELIKASGCTLALVDHSTSHILLNSPEVIQFISDGRSNTPQQDKGLLAEDPAMIFPTSGSTGNPKLITYSTTTIQVKVQSSIQLMRIPQRTRVLIAGSHSNYGFLHHALVFLLSGNAIYLTNVMASGFNAILNAITNFGVRHVRFTPSLFRKLVVLPKAERTLRLLDAVRFSGEPLLKNDLKLAQSVLKPDCLIQNIYGSTESTLFVWSNIDNNSPNTTATVPIGKIYPLSSYSIQPLEDSNKDTTKGELLIRSAFHAIGDFEEGSISRNRFPLLEGSKDERIYTTGDIVQQLPDGNLIHLGRLGRMVKIRGNRVFLSEIEQQLRSIVGVTGAAVVYQVEQDSVALYGFITKDTIGLTSEDLRRQLSARLPDFMIPKSIETIVKIPLMAGSKTDYQTLATLISKPDSLANTDTLKNDYTRLIQVWDSILWKGAHNYHSDFFSLGGDSLSFMVLLVEIEQHFGKILRPFEIRTNYTIQNFADILGIHWPSSQPTIEYKSLKLRLFSPSIGLSKGIALAVPGFGGLSHAYPFHRAGFFQDHDIWIVEFPINDGNMLQAHRWWIAALEIVQGIKDGIIPTPRVIFGFSFGGGLAWLIGHLLAGSHMCPEFVVMVDAPPLHKRRKLRHKALKKALKNVSTTEMPQVLHIRRSTLGMVGLLGEHKQEWNQNDSIRKVVDLPTFDHSDMINWEMLALVKDTVNAFLNDKEANFQWNSILSPPNLLGCHIFYAFNGSQIALQKVMDELTKGTESLKLGYLIDFAILMYTINDKIKSEEIIQLALKKWPGARSVHYVNRRMRRNANLLFFEGTPNVFPLSIVSIENKLTALQKITVRPKPRSIRFLCLAFDIASALLAYKWKNK